MKEHRQSQAGRFLHISVLTFLTLILCFFGLPAILLLLQIPSFKLQWGLLELMRWQNNVEGSAIHFNLLPLLVIALGAGFLGLFLHSAVQNRTKSHHAKNAVDAQQRQNAARTEET